MIPEPVAITLRVVEALNELEAPYFITGSLASAVHGVVRTTVDVDLVVQLQPDHAELLTQRLDDQFYAKPQAIRSAILRRSSFNLIHMETMFKVDIFVPEDRPYKDAQFERRKQEVVATEPARSAYIATAEDTVLAKLEWCRAGGEVSDLQWRDVLGVLRAQGDQLDTDYLIRWATELGIAGLLDEAFADAGLDGGANDGP